MADGAHEDLDGRLLHRMLFFTDAVFAIVLTLLVLELKPPEGPREEQLAMFRAAAGHFIAFGMSFLLIGGYWVIHMSVTRRLVAFDWRTALANLLFLFPVCLIPFATAWLGGDLAGVEAWTGYSAVLIATSLANAVFVLTSTRDGGRLVAGGVSRQERGYRLFRALIPGLAFLIGLVALQLRIFVLAWNCWIFIPLLFLVANRFLAPKPATPAAA